MRFCLLNTFFPPMHFGGDAVFVASLANLLAEAGHHVEVVHCADSFELLRGDVRPSPFPLHEKVIVHTLRSPLRALAPLGAHCIGTDWFQSGALEKILSQGFDVTHWHNASLLGAPGAFRWGSGLRLMTLHDYWLVCSAHVLFRNGEENCTRRTCLKCTLRRGRPPQLWRSGGVVRHGLDNIDLFLAPSEFVENKIREYLPTIPLKVLPHFLTSRRVLPVEKEDYYLIVARLERAKGIEAVIPLFRENGLPLKIAGAGQDERFLQAAAAGAPNIQFLGRVPHGELPALFQRARATIVPSICEETFGLVVLESLQQKTPVYVTRFGALPGLVAQTGGGRVFDSVDELRLMLGTELPIDPNLSAFNPHTHLQNYLRVIQSARVQTGVAATA